MNFFKIFLSSLLVFSMIGCSATPEDAVHNVYDGLKEGNVVKVVNNSSEKLSGALLVNALNNCSADKKSYPDELELMHDCLVEKYQDIKVKKIKVTMLSEVEADANITVEINLKEHLRRQKIRVIDSKWKLDI